MIIKHSRGKASAVESLKQSGFTGSKGVDEVASALAVDSVLHAKNFDVDFDGGLILRKPIVCLENIPEVKISGGRIDTTVLYTKYLYDKEYLLVLREDTQGVQYLGIFKNGEPSALRLRWTSWQDYTEYGAPLTANSSGYVPLSYLDLKHLHFINTATSSVCTYCYVNIADPVFRRADATYPDASSTDLFYTNLYDYSNSSPIKVFKPRTIIISTSLETGVDFDLSITTPDVSTISSTQDLALDVNLDADNPYALRDVYDTSAPTVKNIIAYVPTRTVSGITTIAPEEVYQRSDSVETRSSYVAPAAVTTAFDPGYFAGITAALPEIENVPVTHHFLEWNLAFPDVDAEAGIHFPIHIPRDFTNEYKINIGANIWVRVQLASGAETHHVLIQVGDLSTEVYALAGGRDLRFSSVPFTDSPIHAVSNIKFTTDFYVPTIELTPYASAEIANVFTSSEVAANVLHAFISNGYRDTDIPYTVHGLSGYYVTALADVPDIVNTKLDDYDLYQHAVAHRTTLSFKYPVFNSKYAWRTATFRYGPAPGWS